MNNNKRNKEVVPETVGEHVQDLQERLDAEFSREIVKLRSKTKHTGLIPSTARNCERLPFSYAEANTLSTRV